MKTTYSLILAAASCGLAFGAETAYTTPVGYATVAINGNVAASSSGAATFVSPTLQKEAVFAGAATSSPSGGNSISFLSGVPLGLDFTYVLEISNGTEEGWWSPVTSSTATSITVADAFPASLAADVKITVRKFATIKSLLGANAPGLTDIDGVDSNPPDEVQILNPLDQSARTVAYVTGVAPDGWYDIVTLTPADDEIILPGTSVKIVRYAATGLSLVGSGEVKTTKTQVDIYPNFNWLGQPLAANATLGSMNFVNQLIQFDGADANDFLEILAPDQVASQYVALVPAFGGVMADIVTTADSTNVPIEAVAGYIIQRDASKPASVITLPAQVIGQ